MGKKKELAFKYTTSAHFAYWHAQDFKDAADVIYKSEPSTPVIVNLAFSCELYIKSLLMLQRKSREIVIGHELDKLLSQLDKPIQERIFRESNIENCDEFIKDSSNAFEEWRYYYEDIKETRIGHISGLFKLADTLDKICTEIFSVKENQNG